MSEYLLDTNVALIALSRPDRLSLTVHKAISKGPNVLSVISYWEVILKCRKGKLDVGDPRIWWTDAVNELAATCLPLRPNHVAVVYDLTPIHDDPFDRVLIAQAIVENLTLVTTDTKITQYASRQFRVLS